MGVKVGLIGAGTMGRRHLDALHRDPRVEIAGVADVVAASARSVAETVGARPCGSLAELADLGVQAVFVTLPNAFQTGLVLSVISGSPFNITTGFDDNSDTVANDRPAGVTRNTGRGPRTVQLDLRFAKTFNIAPLRSGNKRDSFDLIVDVFNATNRTNVSNTVGVLSSPFFGRGNSAATARTAQFGVRYRFRR